MKLSMNDIKHISDELDCGMLVYIDLDHNAIKAIPSEEDMEDSGIELWQQYIDEIASWENVLVLEPLESFWTYRLMEDFLEYVDESHKREKLEYALNHSRPFAHFKDLIYKFDLEEAWFPYRDERYRQEVIKNLPTELKPDPFAE